MATNKEKNGQEETQQENKQTTENLVEDVANLQQTQQQDLDNTLQQIDNVVNVLSNNVKSNKIVNTVQANESENSNNSTTNSNSNQSQTSTQTSMNDSLKVRIVRKLDLEGDTQASLRDPMASSSEIRIVEKNDLETDVIADLREPEYEHKDEVTRVEYTPIVEQKEPDLVVNSVTVNEGSPYVVFEVTGQAGQLASLGLSGQNNDGSNLSSLEYFNGTSWVNYSTGNVPLDSSGKLLVRVALSQEQESALDGPETFNLVATNKDGVAANGVGTIVDDGTGSYFAADNNTGVSNVPNGVILDDDRPLSVNSITVNEGSPYAVFEVSGAANQLASLGLSGQNSDGSNLSSLEYFNGTSWVAYTSGNVNLDSNGKLLVRVALSPEQETTLDGPETFNLVATNTSGSSANGVGTIVDDGTGSYFAENNNTPNSNVPNGVVLDDDRFVTVTSLGDVNEESPYAMFKVESNPGKELFLQLNDGTATLSGETIEFSYDGTNWTTYNSSTALPTVPSNGIVYVRNTIDSEKDSPYEGSEDFSLKAIYKTDSTVTGIDSTNILDNGTGNKFTGNVDNSNDTPATNNINLDDDRVLSVNSVTVNEGSPYIIFEVTGVSNQSASLSLANQNSDGSDLSSLEYFDGISWQTYTSGNVNLDSTGKLLVRVALSPEQETAVDGPETFNLVATNLSGNNTSGLGTIVDDGTGSYFAADNNDGISIVPSGVVLDDDRPLSVNNIDVNEASPYAVFTVTGAEGQNVKLALGNTAVGTDTDATLDTDTTNADSSVPMQYYNGSSWVDYVANSYVQIPTGKTTLLVRTGIVNDSPYEGAETFILTATNTGGSTNVITTNNEGIATIHDDGTGNYYPDNTTGDPYTPQELIDNSITLDDDRTLTVNNISVNEGSPYAVFTITAEAGETISLSLSNGSAIGGSITPTDGTIDYGNNNLEYWNGSSWTTYSSDITVGSSDTVLVRTTIVNDSLYESDHDFTLTATYTSGISKSNDGIATIKDDGTGIKYPDSTPTNDTTPVTDNTSLDDDRKLILDLDDNNSTDLDYDYTTAYALGKTGVSIGDIDVDIYSDFGSTLTGATITLTSATKQTGDLLFADILPNGITASSYNSTTGVITLTSATTNTLAEYQQAIEAIKFYNSDTDTTTTPALLNDRTIEVTVTDGTNTSNIATTTINVATNSLYITSQPSVYEGDTAVFNVSLTSSSTGSATKVYLTTSGVATDGTDYNSQLMYQQADGTWVNVSSDLVGGSYITIPQNSQNVFVKIVTIADGTNPSDDGESLILNGTLDSTIKDANIANNTASATTIITEYPSLKVTAQDYVMEGNKTIYEVSLTKPKDSVTPVTLTFSGDANITDGDYSSTIRYSIDGGLTWTTTLPTEIPASSGTNLPSILVEVTTLNTDASGEGLENLTLTATTTDSGIYSGSQIASDTTVIIEPISLTVTEQKDGVSITEGNAGATSVTATDLNYNYVKVSDGLNGTVVDNGNGTLTYTPSTDFSGSDSFSYLMIDKTTGETITATANVTVTAVADTPDVSINITSGILTTDNSNVIVNGDFTSTTSWKYGLNTITDTDNLGTVTSTEYISSSGDYSIKFAPENFLIQEVNLTSGQSYSLTYDTLNANDNLEIYFATVASDGTITILGSNLNINNTSPYDAAYSATYTGIIPTNANAIIFKSIATNSGVNADVVLDNVSFVTSANYYTYDVGITYGITDIINNSTEYEFIQDTITLTGVPSGATFTNDLGTDFSDENGLTTRTFTQTELVGLKITVPSNEVTGSNSLQLTVEVTSEENSNNSTASNTATSPAISEVVAYDDAPTIGDINVTVANQTNLTTTLTDVISTYYSADSGNIFSWDSTLNNIPDIYVLGQKLTFTTSGNQALGQIGGVTYLTITANMDGTDGSTTTVTDFTVEQSNQLFGVQSIADGGIVLPGGGNNDYVILGFKDSNGDTVVDCEVIAHNTIQDTQAEIDSISPEHTVNTNNYYIGVDSNNMNAGDQLIMDFSTSGITDGTNTTTTSNISSLTIDLFNYNSDLSVANPDALKITYTTLNPDGSGGYKTYSVDVVNSMLSGEYNGVSGKFYTLESQDGYSITDIQFDAGSTSSFKLGIASIGSIVTDKDFEIQLGYSITDENGVSGETDTGIATISFNGDNSITDTSNDSYILYQSGVTTDAGAGTDTLILDSGINIDFSTTQTLSNFEQIDLIQEGNHTLSNIAVQDILDITDSNNSLTILGDATDSVSLKNNTGETWSTDGVTDSDGYKTYVNSGDNSVSLKIDADITPTII